ncbi:hypothetical protein NP233_g1540 [Leucocoprinus birnbaumii]|uniref:Flavin-containing monooxygenase n=1 Tax=Leucocoprinus birnbaumii TaxID=56174 RepID=A0AAD5VZS6_9AGAR|nr:hypothetical protein NP233_g1540 [Leucocoprinus birnbaumii]
MSSTFTDTIPLPTLDSLNASVPPDLDALAVTRDWFTAFSADIQSQRASLICDDLLLPTAVWRDLLALTWDFRILRNSSGKISAFLSSQIPKLSPREFQLREQSVVLQRPYPDYAFISATFDFRTNVGICSGIIRLVPTESGAWKAQLVFTNLEDLIGFPEKIGFLRNPKPNHGLWEQERAKELEFLDRDPQVVVIGAGQGGLVVAARLRALGVSVLVVEKNERIGDNWRNRYDALCLHDPVWYDHMPYMPFPSTWPVFTPARKLANWLEHYAEALEIPVWTSTTIHSATQSDDDKWRVELTRQDGSKRTLVAPHLVFATGWGGGAIRDFHYPGLDKFKGQYLHSTQHKRALDHAGKKVVVVGSGTSAHDIAKDYYDHGIDITMVQRGPTYVMSADRWEWMNKGLTIPLLAVIHGIAHSEIRSGGYWEGGLPTDVADRLGAAFHRTIAIEMFQRRVRELAELDKELLDGLRKVGFKLSYGEYDCGVFLSASTRGGGYYIDVGASQLIIDGKIKLKNDSTISEITETGVKFANGSELDADVIVFATGFGDSRAAIRTICGNEVANNTKPLWDLDSEGETNGVWRDTGVKNMWYAFEIKAIEEGIFGERYSMELS